MPGGGETWTWTGDIGAMCGQAWEHGEKIRGYLKNGDAYYPSCTWLDTAHGADVEPEPKPITNRQMKIDVTAYRGNEGLMSKEYYCGATIFSWKHDEPIAERPSRGMCCDGCAVCLEEQAQAKRSLPMNTTATRSPRPRNQQSAEKLIVNSRSSQSAITLCNSPTSRGSDFASIDEGLFCDMDTKVLYPLCNDKIVEHCFDLEAEQPHLRQYSAFQRRDLTEPKYKYVSYWD